LLNFIRRIILSEARMVHGFTSVQMVMCMNLCPQLFFSDSFEESFELVKGVDGMESADVDRVRD